MLNRDKYLTIQAKIKAQNGLLRDRIVNKKQLVVMWVGIGTIILGLLVLLNASYVNSPYVGGFDGFRVIPRQIFLFVLWVFGVVIVTADLIVSFSNNNYKSIKELIESISSKTRRIKSKKK